MDQRAPTPRVERLRALFAAGATAAQAGAALGISRSTAHAAAATYDLQRRRRGLAADKKKKLHRALRTTPATYQQLADLVGVSSRTAWLHAQALGVVRSCRPYFCAVCRATVNLRPCPGPAHREK